MKSNRLSEDWYNKYSQSFLHPHINYQLYVVHPQERLNDESNSLLCKLLMFAIYRLCEHPKYIKPLTDEVENMLKLPEADQYKHLPLMESFLREAARYDPLDSCRPPKLLK